MVNVTIVIFLIILVVLSMSIYSSIQMNILLKEVELRKNIMPILDDNTY